MISAMKKMQATFYLLHNAEFAIFWMDTSKIGQVSTVKSKCDMD